VSEWRKPEDDARLERWLRGLAPPLALGLMFLVVRGDSGRGLASIFSAMWLHELGHAIAGWLCGFAALPGPWKTAIPEERSAIFSVLFVVGLLAGAVYAWWVERPRLAIALALFAEVPVVLTLGLSVRRAQAFILFAGDGGALVLGGALVATFWASPRSKLYRGWLRWGFLVLGAASFATTFSLWWRARRDPDVIPFGEIDGVGDSDPSRLVDAHGWSVHGLVSSYVTLGVTVLLMLVVAWIAGMLLVPPGEELGLPED
jgi:hypothetical protein